MVRVIPVLFHSCYGTNKKKSLTHSFKTLFRTKPTASNAILTSIFSGVTYTSTSAVCHFLRPHPQTRLSDGFFVNGWRVPAGAKGDVSCLNVKLRVFSSLHFIDWVCMSGMANRTVNACMQATLSLSIPHPYQVFLTGICYSSLTSLSYQPLYPSITLPPPRLRSVKMEQRKLNDQANNLVDLAKVC